MEDFLRLALNLVHTYHSNKEDKNGRVYTMHLYKVMSSGLSDKEKIVGLLHDLIEDNPPLTVDYLKGLGFPEDIVSAIGSLTRLDGENYNDYIERVSKDPLARKVKINDLKDNLDVTRFKSLDESNLSLLNRYLKAYHYLINID